LRKKRFFWIVSLLLLILGMGCGPPGAEKAMQPTVEPSPTPVKLAPSSTLTQAPTERAVFIIAHQGFRDEEYTEPRTLLEEAGMEISVASSSLEIANGMLGGQVRPDLLVSEVRAADYDAVIFVGGAGAAEYWDDPQAHRLAREAVEQGKVLAAICIAPATLAKAGVLEGKKATVFQSARGEVEAGGATYTGEPVVRDGLIITANGPAATRQFGEMILQALEEQE